MMFVNLFYLLTTGQYLYNAIFERDGLEVAFLWNRTVDTLKGKVPEEYILTDLADFAER